MVKYFSNDVDIRTSWDHVVSAFWQRYPNPFSTHVLTEDVVFREVTVDQRLLSRRLLTKTNRMPRWAEFLFPSNLSRSVYIVEDSVVDPVTKSLTTYTWNLNHTTLMVRDLLCWIRKMTSQVSTRVGVHSPFYDGGGALRIPGGPACLHAAQTRGLDLFWSLRLLQTYPGVWLGPLQEQPGEGHEGPGVRSV
eukprot:XP_014050274.1 PREDICTED: PRELI domain-containing protein 1, mitochondrial-like isoform X2 [Salmo salar]